MKYKTLFRLLLKAIGVMKFSFGAAELLSSMWFVFDYSTQFGRSFSWQAARMFISPVGQIALALYLFFDGRWIADLAIPGNRPYCPECGYDLTGATGEVCNECGTPLPRRV